jgi:hypothetical protein
VKDRKRVNIIIIKGKGRGADPIINLRDVVEFDELNCKGLPLTLA